MRCLVPRNPPLCPDVGERSLQRIISRKHNPKNTQSSFEFQQARLGNPFSRSKVFDFSDALEKLIEATLRF